MVYSGLIYIVEGLITAYITLGNVKKKKSSLRDTLFDIAIRHTEIA